MLNYQRVFSRSVAALPGPLSLGHLPSAPVALRRRGGQRHGAGALSAADDAGTEIIPCVLKSTKR